MEIQYEVSEGHQKFKRYFVLKYFRLKAVPSNTERGKYVSMNTNVTLKTCPNKIFRICGLKIYS